MGYDRLTAQDASFLHIETPNAPMHVGSLGIFEGEPFFDDAGRFRLDDARRIIGSRLDRVPRFRKKIMSVPWEPEPAPSAAQLLAETLRERATEPAEIVRSLRAAVRGPRRATARVVDVGRAVATPGRPVPRTSLNVRIGPHRRFEVVRADLE